MERIAAIVEGHTEEHFVRSTYGNVQIARPIPNGREVTTEVVIEAIIDALEVFSGAISKVLILLDREQRAQTAEAFLNAIADGLATHVADREIYIGVADMQIETWVIADQEHMRAKFDPNFTYMGDGCKAKAILHDLSGGVSRGPRDTALLLKGCSALRSAGRSPSLQRLLAKIDFEWHWAKN